jgi:L-fucose mutarotase
MLKGIPAILSPQLLKVWCEMGHSDTIVIADGNFPAETIGKDAIVIRADGHGVPELLGGPGGVCGRVRDRGAHRP